MASINELPITNKGEKQQVIIGVYGFLKAAVKHNKVAKTQITSVRVGVPTPEVYHSYLTNGVLIEAIVDPMDPIHAPSEFEKLMDCETQAQARYEQFGGKKKIGFCVDFLDPWSESQIMEMEPCFEYHIKTE